MSIKRTLSSFAGLVFLAGSALAQAGPTPAEALGPENAALAQRTGLWDVVETVWATPTSAPVITRAVAERRMYAGFLEELLEPAPNAKPADVNRIDYLSFNRLEGRWKYVSMDMRAPVGLMPAASVDRGDPRNIHLTFEPFSVPLPGSAPGDQLLIMQELIIQTDANHDRKDQYFNLADGSGQSWLAHRYSYVRRTSNTPAGR